MCFVEVQPTNIHLKGISRIASFKIINKNQFLAASYKLQLKENSNSQQLKLTVFPSNGILLHGQQQKIKVKYNAGHNESTLDEFSGVIIIKFTYKIEYNKHYMLKYNLSGWDELSSEVKELRVEILVGGERQAIQHFIKQDIIFNQQFNQEKLQLSQIQQSQNNSFIHEQSLMDLQIESKLDSQRQNSKKFLEKQLSKTTTFAPFQNIMPLQYGESRIISINKDNKNEKQLQKMKYPLVESRYVSGCENKSFALSMKTVENNDFTHEFSENKQKCQNRSVQLLILAVIAAFFVALGNNIGRIIK